MTPFEQAARAAIATRLSPSARENYARALEAWLTHCEEQGADPAQPTADVAAAFRDGLRKKRYTPKSGKPRKYSPGTIWNYLSALSFIYRFVVAQHTTATSWNPFDTRALPRPPVSKAGTTEDVSKDVAEALINAAREAGALRDAALLQLFYSTGARRMSIVSLRRDALRRRDGRLFARIQSKGSGGAELNEITIPEDAAELLAAWLEKAPASPFVFPGRDRGRPFNFSYANKIVTRWGRAIGAAHVHPHRFRAAFITTGFDAGIPLRDLQASVGHLDPKSTLRYDRGSRGGAAADVVSAFRKKGAKTE